MQLPTQSRYKTYHHPQKVSLAPSQKSPSPTVHTVFHFLEFHVIGNIHYVLTYVCLFLLGIMPLRFSHLVACISSFSLFAAECNFESSKLLSKEVVASHIPASNEQEGLFP